MNKRLITLLLLALLVLVACGGGETAEPTSNNPQTEETTSTDETEPIEETEPEEPEETEPEEEMEPEEEPEDSEEATTEEPTEEMESAETATDELPMSGTDSETGLVINPERINPGDTVIIRGEIVSMNLTPTTSPEFVMQAPNMVRYRIRAQDLADVYYQDGTQLEPYQYRQGMHATATVTLDEDATVTDLGITEDFTLLNEE